MRTKILILLLSTCCLLSCTDGLWNAIEDLNKKYENLDDRVSRLEELCKEMNTNIAALQTLVKVMLGNDYIVSITPIMKEDKEIGYVITFAIHDPITIYHGQNGADGKDGKDGQDGVTPIIGVALDPTDNAYYWTLNGDWLLDVNGNRIPLTSRDGKDGQDGQPGQNGQDGKDGKDGITPQLKIENGYWYVSTDNGATWTQLGKAVGEDGQDGKDGKDGQDGDSMFKSVTQDNFYVYFVLQDGTVLKVSKNKKNVIPFPFSVSATKQVYFSHGNLQYQASTDSWRIARNQFDVIGASNSNISPSYEGWIDLFGWGTSGYNMKWPFKYNNFDTEYGDGENDIANTLYDWGLYNYISDDNIGTWRTLTQPEWNYLFTGRTNASTLYSEGSVYGIYGMIILPDSCTLPTDITFTPQQSDYTTNSYTLEQWVVMENNGALFLPANGERDVLQYSKVNSGYYWSSTYQDASTAYLFHFWNGGGFNTHSVSSRSVGRGVRLVQDVE